MQKIRESTEINYGSDYNYSRPPYGYMKAQEDHNKIFPNPETAPIVKYIFQMCTGGLGSV